MKMLMVDEGSSQSKNFRETLSECGHFNDVLHMQHERNVLDVVDNLDEISVVIISERQQRSYSNLKTMISFFTRLMPTAIMFYIAYDDIEDVSNAIRLDASFDNNSLETVLLAELTKAGKITATVQSPIVIVTNSPPNALSRLSPRHKQVLHHMAEGLSNKEIASRLGIAEGTVKSHSSIIMKALGVENRTQAALIYQKEGA